MSMFAERLKWYNSLRPERQKVGFGRVSTLQMLRRTLGLLLVGLPSGQLCFAQAGEWQRLKLIQTGKKVSVKLRSGRAVDGKTEGWTGEWLGVLPGKKPRRLALWPCLKHGAAGARG